MNEHAPTPDREQLDTGAETAGYAADTVDTDALAYDGIAADTDQTDDIPEEAPDVVTAPAEATAGGWPAAARALVRAELLDDANRGGLPGQPRDDR